MSETSGFQMTPFQRGAYRHHVITARQWQERQAKSRGLEAAFTRILPLNLQALTRILRLHTTYNRGEGAEQAMRVIAEIDDHGAKGVLAATIDRLYGLVEFRFRYRDDTAEHRTAGAIPFGLLYRTEYQPYVFLLYRLCELLDKHGERFIGEALAHPEGFGFPKFTRDGGRDLLGCLHGAALAVRSGVPEGLVEGRWYAMRCTPMPDDPWGMERLYLGEAFTRHHGKDDWHFRPRGISVTAENGGYGRLVPSPEERNFEPWLQAFHGKIFPWHAARLEALRAYVNLPFHGTSRLMAECLKTV